MTDSRTVKTVSLKTIRKYNPELAGKHHPLGRERASSPGESSVQSSASLSASQRGSGVFPPTPEQSAELPDATPSPALQPREVITLMLTALHKSNMDTPRGDRRRANLF